jgi:hypothetical protein
LNARTYCSTLNATSSVCNPPPAAFNFECNDDY